MTCYIRLGHISLGMVKLGTRPLKFGYSNYSICLFYCAGARSIEHLSRMQIYEYVGTPAARPKSMSRGHQGF